MDRKKIAILSAAAVILLGGGILLGILIGGKGKNPDVQESNASVSDAAVKLADNDTQKAGSKTSEKKTEKTDADETESENDYDSRNDEAELKSGDSSDDEKNLISDDDSDNEDQPSEYDDTEDGQNGATETGKSDADTTSTGNSDDDRTSAGNSNDDKTSAGKTDDDKTSAGKTDDGKTSAGKTDDGKTSAGKTDDGKTSAGKTDDGKTSAGKSDDDKISTGKSDDGKTSAGKTDDGNTSTGKTDTGKTSGGSMENDKTGSSSKGTTKIVSTLDTGKLTEKGNGYEGTKGTGKYNYGEALQKSLLFYELQRSGDLPEKVRCNWRGDSCLKDGSDNGVDLTGGWYDAGDNVKFNLPMAYTASMLGWSILESKSAYKESGQLEYALSNIKWANDYFIKCHPSDEVYYYQVGNGSADHSYWGAAETVEYRMDRPSYKVTKSSPGSAVCGETAASLAICSIAFKDTDKAYSDLCLKHAKSLYKFARDTKSDAGYTAANGFYDSWSGFYDELAWSGAWLYKATGDSTYLTNAKADFKNAGTDYDWSMCWDDVHIGAAVILADLTGDSVYTSAVEKHLDWWSKASSNHITYSPKGLAWLDSWGSLRYATTTAYIAAVYADSKNCSASKAKTYWNFAESQINYALGDGGRSYVVGFGTNPPKSPHHRTAQGSYCDNMNEPSPFRHTLYGALVGGPDANDGYTDTVSDYNKNEVACDYNAGFTGILAKMYGKYKGQTLKDFGAVEDIDINEIYVEGGINVEGSDFIELRAYICNTSAWPARVPNKLEFRYYVDLSEVYKAGGNASKIQVTTNYMAAGKSAGLKCWDEDKHIYYLSIDFSDALIYPGGQDKYKKEIQVRMRNENGVWDNSNDPSFYNMATNSTKLLTKTALYENGKLIFGTEPAKGKNAGQSIVAGGSGNGGNSSNNGGSSSGNGSGNNGGSSGNNSSSSVAVVGTAKNASLSVSVDYDSAASSSSSISGRINIVNNSDGTLAVNNLKLNFYFTNEDGKSLSFDCYHTAINGANGAYTALSDCTGSFSKASGKDTDTVCVITYGDKTTLGVGDTLTCAFAIHHQDWSNMNLTNDYSVKDAANIVINNGSKVIFGTKP